MPPKIYLDENIASHLLKNLLTQNGFEVKTPTDIGLIGQDDQAQFDYAKKNNFVLLTRNPSDFIELHDKDPHHSGIIGVYQDNDVKKDMSYQDMLLALKKLVQMKFPLKNNFVVLNHYRKSKK